MTGQQGEFVAAPEVAAFREAVREYCRKAWDEHSVRSMSEHDRAAPDAWRALGNELGVLGLTVPEQWGGGGAGLVEAAVVAEELGTVLAPLPYLSAVLAARLLVASGNDAACAVLPGVCDGTRTMAVAGIDGGGRGAARAPIVATRDGGDWVLSADAPGVVDADITTDLLVVTGGELFHVDGATPGLYRVPVPTMDLTRSQADITFDRCKAARIGLVDPTASDTATVLLAAEQVGLARAMLDAAVSYACERKQFGRTIGSFKAIKQHCADMLVELELARSVAAHAAWAHDHDGDDLALAASLAHVVASDAARRITGTTIQVLGGVAITWEHRAHLYYKRAVANAALWGGRRHRSRLAMLAVSASAATREGSKDAG